MYKLHILRRWKILNKNKYRYLNIKGTVLDNYQLQNYMEKIATSHEIKRGSDIKTYPIFRLKENFKFIEKTYGILRQTFKTKDRYTPCR